MNKRAKTILAYSLLAIFITVGLIFFARVVIAYTIGDSALGIEYRLIEENLAGRRYTPTCLVDCHLPFCVSYVGDVAPSTLAVNRQDVKQYFNFLEGVDESRLEDYGIDYLTTETYYVDVPDYGTCKGTRSVYNNLTDKNETEEYTYPCIIGSHQEQRIRGIWKPLKDISEIEFEKNKEVCFDIWGKLELRLGDNFAVDVVPSIKFQNKEFIMTELAWWNSNWTRRKNITLYNSDTVGHDDETVLINITGLTLSTGNCSKELVITNETDKQIDSQTLMNGTDPNTWCYVAFKVNISSNTRLNYSAYYDYSSATENDEVIYYTYNTSGKYKWGFEDDAVGSPPDGWYEGQSGGAVSFHVTDQQYYSGSKGLNMSTITGWKDLSRNFTESLTEPFPITTHYWVYSDGNSGQYAGAFLTKGHKRVLNDIWEVPQDVGTGLMKYLDDGSEISDGIMTLDAWIHISIVRYNQTTSKLYENGVLKQDRASHGTLASSTLNTFYIYRSDHARNAYDDVIVYSGQYYGNANITANATLGAEEEKPADDATESEGDSAIQAGIASSVINASQTNYTAQQVYAVNVSGDQVLGKFDVLVSSGNQRWAFNYVTTGDPTSGFTYMMNITPVLYVWEAQQKSIAEITSEVQALIDDTWEDI